MAKKQERESRSANQARQPTPVDRRIGQLIRGRRAALSLNQQELAEGLGIALHQLHKYETGENRVSASRLVDIAHQLGVPVAWFFESGLAVDGNAAPSPSDPAAIELVRLFEAMNDDGRRKLVGIARLLKD